MEKDIKDIKFLTPKYKEYYIKDFYENVVPCKDDYWKLDDGLLDILKRINNSNNIQTIYSRRDDEVLPEYFTESYLHFSITESVVDKIEHIFKIFENEFPDLLLIDIGDPQDFIVNDDDAEELSPDAKKLGCVNNIKYFDISVFIIWMRSENIEDHENFWKLIDKHLTML